MNRKSKNIIDRNPIVFISFFSILIIVIINVLFPKNKPENINIKYGKKISCELINIIDGDTIWAKCENIEKLKIRLFGIDAPEKDQEPWAKLATNQLTSLLSAKKFILYAKNKDIYNRQLGIIYDQNCIANQYNTLNENCDINLKMINLGMAVAYDGKDTPKEYKTAQSIAKDNKNGIWSKSGLQQNPKKYRRQRQ